MTDIQLVTEHGQELGSIKITGFLPAFLLIDETLFQRYGEVSAYRYVREPNVWIPPKALITLK